MTTNKQDYKIKPFYRKVRGTFHLLFKLFFRFRSFGQENIPFEGPVLIACNHQSYLDPIVCAIGMERELSFMARDSLFKGRFGKIISELNAFPVKRDSADLSAIRDIVDRLSQQRAVMMFPEGTRSDTGHVKDFKNGFVLIARKAKASIVPAVIDGTFEAWPRNRKLPLPAGVRIKYGQVIPADEVKAMNKNELLERVHTEIREMQNELREKYNRKLYDYVS